MLVYYFICSWMFVIFSCHTIEAPTFDDLQDLEEEDFEQLGGDKCP
jgi:hypothetical protein